MKPEWNNFRKRPPSGDILVCDQWGYVCIEECEYGNVKKLRDQWKRGNGTRLVAWMPLPKFPAHLCLKRADGMMPGSGGYV